MADGSSSIYGYLKAEDETTSFLYAYILGSADPNSSFDAYILGGVDTNDSIEAYINSAGPLIAHSIYAYLASVVRSTLSAYMEGTHLLPGESEMAEYDYIWLKSSSLSIEEKFRVLSQGYDDGTLEKAETLKRTIGGGIDYSAGAVYKSWSPVIRVRASETETNYGSLADLVALYNLNDPGGTPTNVLTFVDHHGDSYEVYMVGSFRKSLMGVKIEGENAWSLVKLKLVEVPS